MCVHSVFHALQHNMPCHVLACFMWNLARLSEQTNKTCLCVGGGLGKRWHTHWCVFGVKSENELNDPQPTQLLTSACLSCVHATFFIALQSALT